MDVLVGSWNWPVVIVSFLISAAGSLTAIYCAKRFRQETESATSWLIAASISMGGGAIWSMHFIGMLAFDMGMPVSYSLSVTLGSLLIAILVTGLGLFVVSSGPTSLSRILVGGIVMGLGVASMHYAGMAGMQMAPLVTYDSTLVGVSVLIAVVASSAALFLAFNLDQASHIGLSALVMATAVCGMHYTGMAAATFTMTPGLEVGAAGISNLTLVASIFAVTIIMLLVLFYQAVFVVDTAEPSEEVSI